MDGLDVLPTMMVRGYTGSLAGANSFTLPPNPNRLVLIFTVSNVGVPVIELGRLNPPAYRYNYVVGFYGEVTWQKHGPMVWEDLFIIGSGPALTYWIREVVRA